MIWGYSRPRYPRLAHGPRTTADQYGARTLQSGTNLLQYNLFTDVARTLVWGDGTCVSAPIGGRMQLQKNTTRITQTQSLPVRGRIPALQDAEQGQYLDVLVITLEF